MKSRARKKPTRMLVEELEPRILYSADAGALVNPAALAPSAEVRSLDAYAMPAAPPVAPTPAAPANDTSAAIATPPPAADTKAQTQRHEMVFVDTSVNGFRQLLEDLKSDATRSIETVLIDASRDGVEQISQALDGKHDLDALHIISHGADGALELGSTTLDFKGLLANIAAIRGWGNALGADADSGIL